MRGLYYLTKDPRESLFHDRFVNKQEPFANIQGF